MRCSAEATLVEWPLHEPFRISRGVQTTADGMLVSLRDGDFAGRGEAYGIPYENETPETMIAEFERVRPQIERGVSRRELLDLLPVGGARCAIDCALWDLEAKRSGRTAAVMAGMAPLRPLETAYTIGLKEDHAALREAASANAHHRLLKIKVDDRDPVAILETVAKAAPASRWIVDPNQSWTIEILQEVMPHLQRLNVALLEQPLPVGGDEGLLGFVSPIPICADELVHDRADLPRAAGKYSHVNLKLDKAGGLTEGLATARAALDQGYRLMVGCMLGSSLAMAPAMLVGQLCDFVDLDGPLLQSRDWPHALDYRDGMVLPPVPALWG